MVTVWPPSQRMSRWVYAVSGQTPIWSLGSPEKISRAITENFGIGADSLDDSDLDSEADEEAQDDLEDQNAAIIRFVNEVIQRAIVDRATDIHFEPHKDTLQIRYRIDGQLVPVRVPDNLRSFQDAIISRIKIMSGINISEKEDRRVGELPFLRVRAIWIFGFRLYPRCMERASVFVCSMKNPNLCRCRSSVC